MHLEYSATAEHREMLPDLFMPRPSVNAKVCPGSAKVRQGSVLRGMRADMQLIGIVGIEGVWERAWYWRKFSLTATKRVFHGASLNHYNYGQLSLCLQLAPRVHL
jgi:hypothetical protein